MADAWETGPKQFRVLKDNGERWTMTFGGGHKGVRWDREDPTVDHGPPKEKHRSEESTPENPRGREWRDYIAERLLQMLEESIEEAYEIAKPHIQEWHANTALPWVKTTVLATWIRLNTRKQKSQPVKFEVAEERATGDAPTSAVVLSERTNEHAQARSSLTPEEAREKLEDLAHLTTLLAAKVRELATSVIKEDGESDERFLERRQQAEQLAVRNVTSNLQVMLEQGTDLDQALALSATYTPALAAGRVEARRFSIEGPSQGQKESQGK